MKAGNQTTFSIPSLPRSIAIGSIGFCLTSVAVFATVAFGERWMYQHLTIAGAYFAWITLYIVIGGTVLGSLVVDRWRLPRFYFLFGTAFFLYGSGWTTLYFIVPGKAREWLGSLIGSLLMAFVFAIGFRVFKQAILFVLLLFISNSVGYFAGSAIFNYLHSSTGMVLWGAVYGLSLGAGLGATLSKAQSGAYSE